MSKKKIEPITFTNRWILLDQEGFPYLNTYAQSQHKCIVLAERAFGKPWTKLKESYTLARASVSVHKIEPEEELRGQEVREPSIKYGRIPELDINE